MRLPWRFTLIALACCTHASPSNGSNEDVWKAVELLESIGVENLEKLCHRDEAADFSSVFPRCGSHSHRQIMQRGLTQQQDHNVAWFDAWNVFGAVLCVCVSAIAAGLTISLLTLDPLVLLIKVRASENEQEKKQAARLVTIVKRRHLLLVSLILCTAVSSEALPIFLQDLMPRYAALLVAVVLVVVFGEVVPAIIFTGPNQLAIASRFAPVVKFIMCLFYPFAAPVAKLLEHAQHGQEPDAGNMYNRGELAALIRIQYEERMAFKQRRKNDLRTAASFDRPGPPSNSPLMTRKSDFNRIYPDDGGRLHNLQSLSIQSEDIAMVEGALQMKTKFAIDIFVPLDKVFAIPSDMVLDEKNVGRIYGSAYSRIPVYERRQDENDKSGICGIFMTRQLIMVKPSSELSVSSLRMHVPFCVSPKMNLVDLVNLFQDGGSSGKGGHMALVCVRPEVGNIALDNNEAIPEEAILMGIITLEDVLEALLQEQIYDEMDAEGRIGRIEEQVEVTDEGFSYGMMM